MYYYKNIMKSSNNSIKKYQVTDIYKTSEVYKDIK